MHLTFEKLPEAVEDLLRRFDRFERLLLNTQQTDEKPLDSNGACDYLGINKQSLYRKVSKGRIPFHKPPGTKSLYFSKKELTDWALNRKGGRS